MDYIQFNLLEGLSWIGLGIISIILTKRVPKQYVRLALFSASVLVLFGISDFAEAKFGSFFEPGMIWLLVWKILCVVGLTVTIIWYLWIRIHKINLKQ
jgi:hypothetical protein